MVAVVAVPDAGGIALVVTAYSYPATPLTADQLISAVVAVILVAVGAAGAGHKVVNAVVTHAEKLPLPQLVRT